MTVAQQHFEDSRGRDISAEGRAVLHIGLLNNMPDSALEQTERQFFRLLGNAAPETPIRWHLFSLRTVARGEGGRLHLIHQNYGDAADLYRIRLDGLILTGAEPLQTDLRAEAHWTEFSALLDWIEREGPPAIFSCMAAHAAALHYDGIERRRLAQKRFGVFDHALAEPHALTAAMKAPIRVAHSRWNELPPEALEDAGYRILTYAPEAGAELFVKQNGKMHVFFQGHPEYERDTLAREYRRDVRRFLNGESEIYPEVPAHYFAEDEIRALNRFRTRALNERHPTAMERFPAVVGAPAARPVASAPVLQKWVRYIDELRAERAGPPPARLSRQRLQA